VINCFDQQSEYNVHVFSHVLQVNIAKVTRIQFEVHRLLYAQILLLL